MNQSKINKKRKQKYINLIDYIAFEMGIALVSDFYWKNKLNTLLSNGRLNISYKDKNHLPEYIKKDIARNKLRFSVKLLSPKNNEDDSKIILEFSSKEFSQITSKAEIANSKNNLPILG